MDSSVTEAQLIEEVRAAFASANAGPEDGMTTGELADAMGTSPEKVRRALPGLIKSGKAEVCRVQRPRWDGILTTVSAIRLL